MKSYRLLPLAMLLPALLSGCSPAESSVQVDTVRPVKLFEVLNVEAGDFRTFPARVAANSRARRRTTSTGQGAAQAGRFGGRRRRTAQGNCVTKFPAPAHTRAARALPRLGHPSTGVGHVAGNRYGVERRLGRQQRQHACGVVAPAAHAGV